MLEIEIGILQIENILHNKFEINYPTNYKSILMQWLQRRLNMLGFINGFHSLSRTYISRLPSRRLMASFQPDDYFVEYLQRINKLTKTAKGTFDDLKNIQAQDPSAIQCTRMTPGMDFSKSDLITVTAGDLLSEKEQEIQALLDSIDLLEARLRDNNIRWRMYHSVPDKPED